MVDGDGGGLVGPGQLERVPVLALGDQQGAAYAGHLDAR